MEQRDDALEQVNRANARDAYFGSYMRGEHSVDGPLALAPSGKRHGDRATT